MGFRVLIEPLALKDIRRAIDYYENEQAGLGDKLKNELDTYLEILGKTPHFRKRYDKVHCLPLKKFPFIIHYTINEAKKIVIVRAVFHTSLNPERWEAR